MCFTLAWLEQMLILAVVVIAVVLMLQALVPYIVRKLGAVVEGEGWGVILTCVRIFLWAIIAICVVIFVFMLISCLLSMVHFKLGALALMLPVA